MALFCLLMALLSLYCLAELPLAGFPTQAQENVDLLKKNYLKSSFIVRQRKVRDLQALYQEHAFFHFRVKHGQLLHNCLHIEWGVLQAPEVQPCASSAFLFPMTSKHFQILAMDFKGAGINIIYTVLSCTPT